MTSCASSRSE